MLVALPESPKWLARAASRDAGRRGSGSCSGPTSSGSRSRAIAVSAIPMVGAWAASKWMIPWADKVAGSANAALQGRDAGLVGARRDAGQLRRAQLASRLGRRLSYFLISVGSAGR